MSTVVRREQGPNRESVPGGVILWEQCSDGVREFLGVTDVEDADTMQETLRRRGLPHGAVFHEVESTDD